MADITEYDVILRNGTLFDGSGQPGVRGDLAIRGQFIAALGDLGAARARQELDVTGLAVAPGFINMLSWATESLIADGRSQSDLRQGVTLEVMGEGFSFGPLNERMKAAQLAEQGDIKYDVPWTTLNEYLEHLVARGVSCNVASFVGTATVRIHVIGHAARSPNPAELETMCQLVREAMADGALGVSSALIYAPDCFYQTDELIALAKAAAEYDGVYISHLRSEGNAFLEALDELITIARAAHIRAEVYHLKAAGRDNWPKLDAAIAKIEAARAEGLAITADMYHYTAGATGLDATMPRWVQEGGHQAWAARLKDPAIRARLRAEMNQPSADWENMYLGVGTPDNILFLAFKNDALKPYTGQTLAQVAAARGTPPEDTIFDLVIEDDSRVGAAFFMMSEDNVRRQVALPWVSVDSDEASLAPEGVFLKSNAHPRAYGTFARYLGHYVRDEHLIPLAEAIRKLTSLPAGVLKLDRRGLHKPGYFADLAIFDPASIQDHATFAEPHQYATGMVHVFVNGTQVLRDGEHTGATPGQVVRGNPNCPQDHPIYRPISQPFIFLIRPSVSGSLDNDLPLPHPRRLYQGESLRALTMPLGGLGTGSIALCGDGSLRQWQIANQINHQATVPHSFFAVWGRCQRPRGQPVARVLQSAALYDTPGPAAPPTANDNLVPPAHRALLGQLPGVQATRFTGEYPNTELAYEDDTLPLQVTLEAFSPFIPLEAEDSGLPAILFNFTVTNPTDKTWLASLGASLQNAAGWDGGAPIDGVHSPAYGGNSNSLARLAGLTALHMSTGRLPEDAAGSGTLALAALETDVTYLAQWDDLHAFWADFADDGRLSNSADSTPSALGRTWNGALAVPFTLAPGETRTVTFVIAWHFPNRYFDYRNRHYVALLHFSEPNTQFWVGNHYANRFRSALDVAAYVQAHAPRLTRLTRLARDTFFDSTLPPALIDAVTSQISVMRTPTCFWAQDGRFYGFEGCGGASTPQTEAVSGSCPLNCTHVWNYEMALARLFPALERTMRETEWLVQQHPTGYLPHRVRLPLYLPRPGELELVGPNRAALDGLLGAILKTYREHRAAGDPAWLASMWPGVRRALDHLWAAHDPARAGLIEGEQSNTYDISIYGLNTFIGTLYLAALLAAEAMAGQVGEADLAAECRAVYERGRVALDQRLWNGEYYVQDVDFAKYPEQNFGLGCHADHLLGQWWAYQLGLGRLLPEDHLRAAAGAIFTHNFRPNFHGVQQAPRVFVADDDPGLVICTWPRGGRPDVPTEYSDEVWTGLEYEVAALLLYEGQPEPALRIVEAARARHDGRKESPWNDIECGDHYARAMAAWGLLEAALGLDYDAAAGTLGFAPTLAAENFRAPFVTAHGWGTFAQQPADGKLSASLTLAHGQLTLNRLRLAAPITRASLDGQTLTVYPSPEGAIEFAQPLTITAGQTLHIECSSKLI